MAPLSAPNQGRAHFFVGFSALFLILPISFVALRLWARKIKGTTLCFNDYGIIAALVVTTGFTATGLFATIKGGYGQHIDKLSLEEIAVFQKVAVVISFIWPTANSLIKISVLHFYKSIFRGKNMAYAVYVAGTLTILYWCSSLLTAILICRPFEYSWNKFTIQGKCGDTTAYYLGTAITNLLIDVLIVALPLPVVWQLQLSTQKKISLTLIFGLGALICIMSAVRCYAIAHLNLTDVTYDLVLSICTVLEPTLGVINACLPLIQPAASKLHGSAVFTWLKSSRSGSSVQNPRQSELERANYYGGGKSDDLYPLTERSAQKSSESHISSMRFH